MTFSILDNLNEKVVNSTDLYNNDRTSDNLKKLIEHTLKLTVSIRRLELNHTNRVLNDFDEDVCLEYIGMVLSNRTISYPRHKIRGIIAKRLHQHNKTTSYNKILGTDFLVDSSMSSYINSKLILSDIITSELQDISPNLQTLILFYTINFKLLKNYIANFPPSLDKFVVVLKVYEIRKKIMNEGEKSFDITFSSNRISNLLMLSGLFNESPEMFVLLTLLGDFKKFLTFVSVFEGKQITVPKISEINEIFKKSSAVSESFDEGSLSLNDRNNLLSLVMNVDLKDVNPDAKMNKFLDEYLVELVLSSIEKYNKIQDKQFKYIDFTDLKKVKESYTIANQELATFVKLLNEIVSTVSTIKEINSAIELIKIKTKDQLTDQQ